MTVLQIKTRLKKQIDKIDNVAFLMAIETIIESKSSEEEPFALTEEQRESIKAGEEQIKKGQYKTSRQVFKNARKWLKSK